VNNLNASAIAFGAISICKRFSIEFLYCMQEPKDKRPADGMSFVDKIWSDEVATMWWVPSTFSKNLWHVRKIQCVDAVHQSVSGIFDAWLKQIFLAIQLSIHFCNLHVTASLIVWSVQG
jgi:hypothetical protein